MAAEQHAKTLSKLRDGLVGWSGILAFYVWILRRRPNQDVSPIHMAHIFKACLERPAIWVIDHPPYSPDENLWPLLKQFVYELHPELKTIRGRRSLRAETLTVPRHTVGILIANNSDSTHPLFSTLKCM